MTVGAAKITFEDFLKIDDGSELLSELDNGELIQMPSESDLNQRIASFLFALFLKPELPWYRIRIGLEIAMIGARVSVRVPDLVLLSEESASALQGSTRSILLMDMPAPLLVVEVVTPGQEVRDYRFKRSEYAARGIREYWIVDPVTEKVTLLEWIDGFYEEAVYIGDQKITSPLLGSLDLTADQILQKANIASQAGCNRHNCFIPE